MNTSRIFILIAFLIHPLTGWSQLSVVSNAFNAYQANAEAMLNVSIMNTGEEQKIFIEAVLLNSTGEKLIVAKSFPFILKNGIYNSKALGITINNSYYGNNRQAEYVRVHQGLPSGNFSLCYQIFSETGEVIYDYCFDIISDNNTVLNLVSPYDDEVIETKYPVLIWFHNEPFDLLGEGEFFRILLCEINGEQSADIAANSNIPVFLRDYVLTHQVPYAIEAIPLQENKRYAWRVQKISRNTIVQTTETWSFKYKKKEDDKDVKYAILTKETDAGFYSVKNDKLYFRFDEDYQGNILNCELFDANNVHLNVKVINEDINSSDEQNTNHGYNRFMIDLHEYHLKKGIYLIEVSNNKKETYKLKFNIE